MEKAKVAVFIGSASDEATVAPCADIPVSYTHLTLPTIA